MGAVEAVALVAEFSRRNETETSSPRYSYGRSGTLGLTRALSNAAGAAVVRFRRRRVPVPSGTAARKPFVARRRTLPVTGTYRTLAGRGEAAFEVRGSEFIGHAAPATDVERAEAFAEAVRGEYDNATHVVPAYRVRSGDGRSRDSEPKSVSGSDAATDAPGDGAHRGMLREYASDDGEPSGSAGKPTLNVLQGRDLENAVVAVVRYYGGTNLGVGGLARAYSRAAKEALNDAGAVEERPHERFAAVVDYDDSGTVRGILESAGVEFEADYADRVRFAVRAPVTEADGLRDRLRSATSGRVELE